MTRFLRLLLLSLLISGCAATPPPTRPGLLDTYWRPVEIDGNPVLIHPGTREPHLVLSKEGSRTNGYAGCNAFSGPFVHAGDALRFGPLAVTQRACIADEGNTLEASFLRALGATASQRITGESLELRDAAGKTRMRLESRVLR